MILEVLPGEREDGGCLDVARLIRGSNERRAQQRIFGREAFAMFQSLRDAGIVTVDEVSKRVQVHVDLQDDFSLHHALSLWLIGTLPLLDRESPTYALDVLTLVESILENPDYVLRQQLDALKGEKVAELKMAGVEYEERMAELEKLEHPKPLREFVYETFNAFAREHPWVRGDDVRPKSIAREMVERFMDFNEYVREYELGRAEGTLLRYLSDAYKALVQTVPAPAKTPEVEEIEVFLRAMVRAVDSSLLDEWERMRHPEEALQPRPQETPGETDITTDERGFTVLVRNAMYQLRFARSLAKDWASAAAMTLGWKAEDFEKRLAPFFEEHASLRLDPSARSPANTRISKETAGGWDVVQVICDSEGDDDWAFSSFVDLQHSAHEGKPVVVMRDLSQIQNRGEHFRREGREREAGPGSGGQRRSAWQWWDALGWRWDVYAYAQCSRYDASMDARCTRSHHPLK